MPNIFSIANTSVPAVGTTICSWTSYLPLNRVVSPVFFSAGDLARVYIEQNTGNLLFQRLSGSATTVAMPGAIRFKWRDDA